MQEQGYLSKGNQRLHYLKSGSGPRLLLAFHGYGNNASQFMPLADLIGDDYTVVSIDLPFHGGSEWDESPVTKEDLEGIVRLLLQQTGHEKLSLAGYSIGGRICLSILEALPGRVEQVLLIAPDGLRLNLLYYFLTNTGSGRGIFSGFLKNGDRYRRYITWLHDYGLLNDARYHMVMRSLGGAAAREKLRKVWLNLRLLLPGIAGVKRNIRRFGIPVHIFMGRYDGVIPVKHAVSFAWNIPRVQVHVLDKGHYLFDTESLRLMAENLL